MVMQMKGRGLSTLMQFVWIKHLNHIRYAVAHVQCLRPNVEADDRKFKTMKESFDKTTDVHGYPLSTKNTGMHNYVMNIYIFSKQ